MSSEILRARNSASRCEAPLSEFLLFCVKVVADDPLHKRGHEDVPVGASLFAVESDDLVEFGVSGVDQYERRLDVDREV